MKNGARKPRKPKPQTPLAVPAETRELADKIRRLFYQWRESRVPGSGGTTDSVHFISAAQLCQQFKETPEVFIATTMGYLAKSGAQFFPQALGSSKVAVKARARSVRPSLVSEGRYRSQLDRFGIVSRFCGAAETLRHFSGEFSPLLRFYLASYHGVPDVMDEVREAARDEFRSDPVASEVFPEVAEELR